MHIKLVLVKKLKLYEFFTIQLMILKILWISQFCLIDGVFCVQMGRRSNTLSCTSFTGARKKMMSYICFQILLM